MWKKIFIIVVLVAAGPTGAFLRYRGKKQAASRPAAQVARGTFVAAPPAKVVAEVVRLQNWVAWSPDKDDPTIKRTYGGPSGAPGASYYWSSAPHGIEGRLTVITVRPDRVELELEMVSPNPSLTDYAIDITPDGSGSRLVWSASGDAGDNFLGKALGSMAKRDVQLGGQVEADLAGLKIALEAQEDMSAYRVERSITIAAPDIFVLGEIMDFREWSKWFPREQLDPELKRVFSGTDAQPGSTYFWSGNDQVGVGRLSMISSSAEKVELEVEMEKPNDCVSDLVFTLVPQGSSMRVVWTITGQEDSSGRAYSLLGGTRKTLGREMEEGLASLKALAEASVPVK